MLKKDFLAWVGCGWQELTAANKSGGSFLIPRSQIRGTAVSSFPKVFATAGKVLPGQVWQLLVLEFWVNTEDPLWLVFAAFQLNYKPVIVKLIRKASVIC
jgi:hypothetical protein